MRCAKLATLFLIVTASVMAQTPKPALLIVNKGANELAIVDPSSMKVVGRVPVGEGPHEVATDGKLAFVANYGARTPGNSISVIDLATQKEIKRVDLGTHRRPHGIVVNGGKVYFTTEINTSDTGPRGADAPPPTGSVNSYDPVTQQLLSWSTGESGTHMLVMTKGGSVILTSNIRSNSVSVIQRGGKQEPQTTTIPVGKGPEAIDISPDGREVWVGHSQDGGISIIDVSSKKVIQTLAIGTKRSNRLKFTPDGSEVFVSDLDAGEVVVLDAKSRKEIKRIKTGGHPEGILMAPGGRVFVALSDQGVIATIDLKTLEVTGKMDSGPDADGMAWAE